MKRLFLAFIAIFLIVLAVVLYDISPAKAASPYDNAYRTTNQLDLESTYYSCQVPVNNDWKSIFLDYTSYANQETATDIIDSLEIALKSGSYAVSQETTWNSDGSLNTKNIYVAFSETPDLPLQWQGSPDERVSMAGVRWLSTVVISGCQAVIYDNGIGNVPISTNRPVPNPGSWLTEVFSIAGINPNYPENYEGEEIELQPQVPASVITPDYQYSVNSNGLLTVTYLNNISPFLSGTNYFVLNRTTDNWQTLGAQIFSESFTPAGWTDKTFEQLLDPGYYVLRISHSQQFDSSSPWYDSGVQVNDVFIQFYWDGETTFTGTTTGCQGQICNILQTDESEKMFDMFKSLGLAQDEFGLGAAVTAPLTFIASLPSKAANCTPIALTLPYVNSQITLPCMSSIYQTHFGLIFSLFQTIMLGLFGYYAAVKVYGNIKQMKDPEDDRIEVVKL